MAILKATQQLFFRHLLWKIQTVIDAGVGRFSVSHVRAVFSGKGVGSLHDVAVKRRWIHVYLTGIFGAFFSTIPIRFPPPIYSIRIHLFCVLMAENIRRALQNINLGIDEAPIALPQAVVQQVAAENRFCLMGRPLMPRKQNLRQIVATLPRSWGLVGFVRSRIVEQRKFQFIFPSEESLETVMRRGPWSFAERMISLQRWSPDFNPFSLNFIPFWIQIRGIPLKFLNLGVIDSIATSLGDKMEVDFDEAAVNRIQFVRVRINWNVLHPLKFQRNYQFTPGVNTTLSFFYERLRGFCDVCGLMTHDYGSCVIQNGGPDSSDNEDDADEGNHKAFQGNPGLHIQEIDDDGQPIIDIEVAEEDQAPADQQQDEPIIASPEAEEGIFPDIDPDHNSLIDLPSERFRGMFRGERANNEGFIYNPLPSFANEPVGDLGPVETLRREIRKRKHTSDDAESSTSQSKKSSVVK